MTAIRHDLPTNTAALACIIESDLRSENDLQAVDAAEVSRMCNCVAHHGARYAVHVGLDQRDAMTEKQHMRAERRIKHRVARDMTGGPILTALLSWAISAAIQWFLRWMFSDETHQAAVAAIGVPLPAWTQLEDSQE